MITLECLKQMHAEFKVAFPPQPNAIKISQHTLDAIKTRIDINGKPFIVVSSVFALDIIVDNTLPFGVHKMGFLTKEGFIEA